MAQTTRQNVPLFILKLWNLVNDDVEVIHWQDDGESFVIESPSEFCTDVIPLFFKHKSLSSFIRQLNMYGFHKVTPQGNGLRTDSVEIQFAHPYFQKGHKELLHKIKRKLSVPKTQSVDDSLLAAILSEIQDSRSQQQELREMYEAHARRTAACEQTLMHLNRKLNKFTDALKSLAKMVIENVKPIPKRSFQHLALEEGTGSSAAVDLPRCSTDKYSGSTVPYAGPIIHEVTEHGDQSNPAFLDGIFTTNNSRDVSLSEKFVPKNRCLMPPDNTYTSDSQLMPVSKPNADPMPLVHSPEGTLLYEPVDDLIAAHPSELMPGIQAQQHASPSVFQTPSMPVSKGQKRPSPVYLKGPDGKLKTIKLQSLPASSSASNPTFNVTSQKQETMVEPIRFSTPKRIKEPLSLSPRVYSGEEPLLSIAQIGQEVDEHEKALGQISALLKNIPSPTTQISLPMEEFGNLFAELNTPSETFGNELTLYDPDTTLSNMSGPSNPESHPKRIKVSSADNNDQEEDGLQTPRITFDQFPGFNQS